MSASDPRGLLAAVVAASVIGYAGENALPFLVGSLIDRLGFDEAQAGVLGSFELGALAAASLILAPVMGRASRRATGLVGGVVAVAGHLASALAGDYGLLVASRLVAGAGEGAVLAAAGAAAAASPDPDRLFARTTLLSGAAAAVFLAAFPYAIVPWGYRGGFALLVLVSLSCVPFLVSLGPAPADDARRVERSLPHRALGVATLVSVILFAVGQGALWLFTERIGLRVGLSPEAVGIALGATTLAGLSGAALASWLSTRRGRPAPLLLGMVASLVSAWALVHAASSAGYVTILLVWGIAFYFAVPYLMGTAAALDRYGRWSAAAMGLSMVGVALGPGAAGMAVARWGYDALGWLVVVSGAGAALLVLPVARAADRMVAALD